MDNTTLILSIGGAMVSGLVVGLYKLWGKLEEKDAKHSEDRKEWFKRLDEILDKQNRTIREVGEGHDKTLREISDKADKRQGEINDTMLMAFKQAFGKQ